MLIIPQITRPQNTRPQNAYFEGILAFFGFFDHFKAILNVFPGFFGPFQAILEHIRGFFHAFRAYSRSFREYFGPFPSFLGVPISGHLGTPMATPMISNQSFYCYLTQTIIKTIYTFLNAKTVKFAMAPGFFFLWNFRENFGYKVI